MYIFVAPPCPSLELSATEPSMRKVVSLRFVDVLELGVRSLNVSVSLSVPCLVVALSDCILSRYLGGLLVITRNLLVLSLLQEYYWQKTESQKEL